MPYVRGINIKTKPKVNTKVNHFVNEVGYSMIGDEGELGDLPVLLASLIHLPKEAVTPRPTSRYELEQEVENLLPDMDVEDFEEVRLLPTRL